jgi:hypothetical protein
MNKNYLSLTFGLSPCCLFKSRLLHFFCVTNFGPLVELLLRRTLVRSVILFNKTQPEMRYFKV